MSTSHEQNYHHGDLRDALIEHALALLQAGEAAKLSLRELARRAGVSPMAPYRHFAGKEELMAAVAARGFNQLAAALHAGDAGPEPLIGQGVAYVGFAHANPALFRLMFGPYDVRCEGELAEAGRAAQQILRTRVASEQEMLAAWAIVHGLAMLMIDRQVPELSETEIAQILRSRIA